MRRCMGCMAEIPDQEEVCRFCGYEKNTDVKEAYYLLPGKIVGQKYMVGRVLGYGGFGVTYIGWDTVLNRKVAIKEYLPSDFATRSYGTKHLTVFSGEAAVQFQAGLDSFISEAKRLAKFNRVPEIVDIYDCFMENETGYIVMEFLDGITVKEMLKKDSRIPVDRACEIVSSVLKGLSEVHKEGIIHRDIAPDNIFVTSQGEVKIFDFGAARYATAVQSRSLSVILKPGYAPEEQYRSRGEQGPWTDVYSLGATLYRMITGIRPEESIERMVEDTIKTPTELGIEMDPNIENALMNSLNVKKEHRIQDAETFYQALKSERKVERVIEAKEKEEELKLPRWMMFASVGVCIFFGLCITLFATGVISFHRPKIENTKGIAPLSENENYVPDVSGMSYDEAESVLKEKNLNVVISGMNYSENIEKNKILSQIPKDGQKAMAEETVYVVMSGGNQEVMMPDLVGLEYKEAQTLINAQNLVLTKEEVKKEYSDYVEKDRVISQSIEGGERIGVQTKVGLTVSLGSLATETAVLTVPDLIGLTKDEAMERLMALKAETGFTYSIGEVKKEYSMDVEKGNIISQGLEPGSEVRTNEPISLLISEGPEMVQMPDVLYFSEEEAVSVLEEAGLTVNVKTEYSSKVVSGLVFSQSVEVGTQVVKGSEVTIKVSLGIKPVSQPQESVQPQAPEQPQTPEQPQEQPQEPAQPSYSPSFNEDIKVVDDDVKVVDDDVKVVDDDVKVVDDDVKVVDDDVKVVDD